LNEIVSQDYRELGLYLILKQNNNTNNNDNMNNNDTNYSNYIKFNAKKSVKNIIDFYNAKVNANPLPNDKINVSKLLLEEYDYYEIPEDSTEYDDEVNTLIQNNTNKKQNVNKIKSRESLSLKKIESVIYNMPL